MQEQADHPTVDELAAFSSGKVEEPVLATIQGHIAHCFHCRAVLKSFPPDELTTLLREAMALPDPPGYNGSFPAPCDLARDTDLPPALVDHPRYRILGKIGAGGMGTVLLAEHRLMKRLVALKVINPKLLARPAAVARFQREVEAVAKLSHPNIAAPHDAEQAGDTHYLVMEFVEGQNLAQVVKEQGALPVAQACKYIRQAALGLEHAHERGLVHRDIKPQNLMRTPDGKIKVLDFGLASLISAGEVEKCRTDSTGETPANTGSLTDFGEGVGTPDYVAPEQIRDAHATDTRADVYALGCTLYYLLAGQPPFAAGTSLQKVAGHLERLPPPLTDFCAELPPSLVSIIGRMMEKEPVRRFQSAADVAKALAPFSGEAEKQAGKLHRGRPFLVALLLIASSLLGFGIFQAIRNRGELAMATEVRQFEGHTGAVRNIAASPDGKYLLSASADKSVRLWEIETGRHVYSFEGHTQPVLSVAFSQDGTTALSGGFDNAMRLWDTHSGQELRCFQGHTDGVHAVAFSPDGKHAASGGLDHTIRLWRLDTGEEVHCFRGHRAGILSVVFLPEGKHLVSGSNDGTARLWDIVAGKELRRFEGHTHEVMGVALSPDAQRIATASHDGTVRIWDIASGHELHRLDAEMNVTCVAFNPDGRRVVFGGWVGARDRPLRVWDLESGQIVGHLEGHTGRISSAVYLPDGVRIVSSGEDQTIRLWRCR